MQTSKANEWMPIGGNSPACSGVYVRCRELRGESADPFVTRYEVTAHHKAVLNSAEALADEIEDDSPLANRAYSDVSAIVEAFTPRLLADDDESHFPELKFLFVAVAPQNLYGRFSPGTCGRPRRERLLIHIEGAILDDTTDDLSKTALMLSANGHFKSERRRPSYMDALEIAQVAALDNIATALGIVKEAKGTEYARSRYKFQHFYVNNWVAMDGDSPVDWGCPASHSIGRLPMTFLSGWVRSELVKISADSAMRSRLMHQIDALEKARNQTKTENANWMSETELEAARSIHLAGMDAFWEAMKEKEERNDKAIVEKMRKYE